MIKFKHSLLAGALMVSVFAASAAGDAILTQGLSPMSGAGTGDAGILTQFEAGMPFLEEDSEGNAKLLQGLIGALLSRQDWDSSSIKTLISDTGDVSMYYDPAIKTFFIYWPADQELRVAVAGVNGEVYYSDVLQGGEAQIDMSSYATGIYMVGGAMGNQIVKTQKILIK